MKQTLLTAALFAAVLPTNAQIETVLYETLKNTFTIPAGKSYVLLAESPEGYEGWSFDNCWAVKDDDYIWVQVGSSSASGSVTTPFLESLQGNARVTIQVYFTEADATKDNAINYEIIGDGRRSFSKTTEITTRSWLRLANLLVRGANSQTRLKIFSTDKAGNEAIKNFQIANILVCDMDKDIYVESFDRMDKTGGNDGSYDIAVGEDVQVKKANLDYMSDNINSLVKGNKCVALGGTEDKYAVYETGNIPFYDTEARKGVLTFKVAGGDYVNNSLEIYDDSKKLRTITATRNAWNTIELEVEDLKNSKLTFKGYHCFLDDIRIRETASTNATFSDQATNASALSAANGKVVNATLTRTLTKDIWNTLCLPFDLNTYDLPDDLKDAGVEVQRLTSVDDGVFRFTPSTHVPAGEPFLIRLNKTVSNPMFSDMPIWLSDNPDPKMFGSFGMAGCIYKHDLATDNTNLFLGTDGLLHAPTAEDHTINGLRAYFIVPEGSDARVALGSEEMHINSQRQSHSATSTLYNLMGMPVEDGQAAQGIYIRNGKKIIIK